MKELFSIGEVGELFGLNVRTLRYYDDIGLLKPERVHPTSGYRYYSTKQFERLCTITYLRKLGMPLEKIKDFFENKDARRMKALLQEQKNEVRAQIERLEMIEHRIDARLAQLDHAMNARLDEVQEVWLPARRVAFLRRSISQQENLEYPIRDLERLRGLKSAMFLGKVGVTISAADLAAGRLENFSGIFVFLEEDGSDQEEVLASGRYLRILFSGTHRESRPSYDRLFAYMRAQGLALAGDSVEITLIDAGMTEDLSQYVTEIQLPVCAREKE